MVQMQLVAFTLFLQWWHFIWWNVSVNTKIHREEEPTDSKFVSPILELGDVKEKSNPLVQRMQNDFNETNPNAVLKLC
jgi:hypothetical protein